MVIKNVKRAVYFKFPYGKFALTNGNTPAETLREGWIFIPIAGKRSHDQRSAVITRDEIEKCYEESQEVQDIDQIIVLLNNSEKPFVGLDTTETFQPLWDVRSIAMFHNEI